MVRVLIVDDEAPSRSRLRQMLTSNASFEVVGEAETGTQAMELIESLKPDLVLLDIQMPGCSGIDVAASLPRPRPNIIFCTAYEQHAVDAFELNAVDYLLKPISRVRLGQALERFKSLSAASHESSVDDAIRAQRDGPARFLAKKGAHFVVVMESRVLYFASEDGLTKLVTETDQYWMDAPLNELETRVDASRFFRISRAALVNLNAVTEVHPLPGGGGEARLKTGERLEISRRRFSEFLESLDGRTTR